MLKLSRLVSNYYHNLKTKSQGKNFLDSFCLSTLGIIRREARLVPNFEMSHFSS